MGCRGNALCCRWICDKAKRTITLERYVLADPDAKALMAIIGNGHIARLPVDAVRDDRVWFWRGTYPARDPHLNALTGPRESELTIPGAGSVVIRASEAPGAFVTACRALS